MELHRRYGDAFHGRLEESFERAGLAYAPPPDVVPNTRLALRLTELARDRGVHEPFHDRLMDGYWAESVDIGDVGELRRLAAEVGLDTDDVETTIVDGDAYLDRILDSTRQAQALGIDGIPAFLLDRRLLLVGAQPRDVFVRAFAALRHD